MKKFLIFLSVVLVIAILIGSLYCVIKMASESDDEANVPKVEYFTLLTEQGEPYSMQQISFVVGLKDTFYLSKEFVLDILPNTDNRENNFTYTINGAEKQFFTETNLKNGFEITESKYSFTILFTGEATVKNILQKVYKGQEVVVPEEFNQTELNFFTLKLTEKATGSVITVNFSLTDNMTVRLDKSELVF